MPLVEVVWWILGSIGDVFGGYIGDILGGGGGDTYPPLSYPCTGGHYIRERGIPERINRTALGAMMARDPLHDEFRLLLLVARGGLSS